MEPMRAQHFRPRMCTTLSELRYRSGLTAYQAAHSLGFSIFEYKELERNPEELTFNQAAKIARFYKIDLDKIVFIGTGEKSSSFWELYLLPAGGFFAALMAAILLL